MDSVKNSLLSLLHELSTLLSLNQGDIFTGSKNVAQGSSTSSSYSQGGKFSKLWFRDGFMTCRTRERTSSTESSSGCYNWAFTQSPFNKKVSYMHKASEWLKFNPHISHNGKNLISVPFHYFASSPGHLKPSGTQMRGNFCTERVAAGKKVNYWWQTWQDAVFSSVELETQHTEML